MSIGQTSITDAFSSVASSASRKPSRKASLGDGDVCGETSIALEIENQVRFFGRCKNAKFSCHLEDTFS